MKEYQGTATGFGATEQLTAIRGSPLVVHRGTKLRVVASLGSGTRLRVWSGVRARY